VAAVSRSARCGSRFSSTILDGSRQVYQLSGEGLGAGRRRNGDEAEARLADRLCWKHPAGKRVAFMTTFRRSVDKWCDWRDRFERDGGRREAWSEVLIEEVVLNWLPQNRRG